MSRKPLPTLAVAVVVIIIAFVALYELVGKNHYPASVSSVATSTASSTSLIINTATTTHGNGYTITPIQPSSSSLPTAPNYATPLTFSSNVTAPEQSDYQGQFDAIQTTLASNSKDWGSWINLGMLRKETGDYTGAAADWRYITEIYPTDATAFADLGDLYANFMNQPAEGISYYKQAIAISPSQESFYENLADIYHAEGDDADARATLEKGIVAKVSGYQNLQALLSSM